MNAVLRATTITAAAAATTTITAATTTATATLTAATTTTTNHSKTFLRRNIPHCLLSPSESCNTSPRQDTVACFPVFTHSPFVTFVCHLVLCSNKFCTSSSLIR